jgi:hypothetical protein
MTATNNDTTVPAATTDDAANDAATAADDASTNKSTNDRAAATTETSPAPETEKMDTTADAATNTVVTTSIEAMDTNTSEPPPPPQKITLPSDEEADLALEQILSSSSPWRDLIMNVLNYGTMYQSATETENENQTGEEASNNKNAEAKTKTPTKEKEVDKNNASVKSPLIDKSNEASTFIIHTFNRLDQKSATSTTNDQDEDITMKDTNDDSNVNENDKNTDDNKNNKTPLTAETIAAIKDEAENVIIDIIWFVGTVLNPIKKQAATGQGIIYECSPHFTALTNFVEKLHTENENENVTPSILSSYKLIARLEPQLMGRIKGLVTKPDKTTRVTKQPILTLFNRCRMFATNLYYRQKRFNILSEECEGYAKLFNYLNGGLLYEVKEVEEDSTQGTATSAKGVNASIISKEKAQLSIEDKIEDVKLRITEFIGTFDLDPNRCMDITIDLFEYQIRQAMLSSSSKSLSMFDLVRHVPEYSFHINLLLGIISMFPVDNVTHLIGFKYSSYQSSTDKDADSNNNNEVKKNDPKSTTSTPTKKAPTAKATATGITEPVNSHSSAPKSLHYTTAVLAAHGYVNLSTLIAHLSPSLSKIKDEYILWRDIYRTKIRKMGVVSLNTKKVDDKKKDDGNDNQNSNGQKISFCEGNQFIQLLNVMVEIGLPWDVICSLFQVPSSSTSSKIVSSSQADKEEIQSVISAACSMYKPLEKNLCEYMKRLIRGLYNAKVSQIGMDLCGSNSTSGIGSDAKESKPVSSSPAFFGKYTLLPATLTHDLGLPETMTLSQFCDSISKPLAPIVATGAIASDPILYCQICRLFRVLLEEGLSAFSDTEKKEDAENYNNDTDNMNTLAIIEEPTILSTLETFIIPSLSLFPYNPAISSELWDVLSILPYQIRYAMYGLWSKYGLEKNALRQMIKKGSIFLPKPLIQIQSEVQSSLETKYHLKRIAKDNIKDVGRQISRIAHNNPLVVFSLILNQIESYDNLILMMVDMFKFMGKLSLDVMGYCLLVSLGGGEKGERRNKLKCEFLNDIECTISILYSITYCVFIYCYIIFF